MIIPYFLSLMFCVASLDAATTSPTATTDDQCTEIHWKYCLNMGDNHALSLDNSSLSFSPNGKILYFAISTDRTKVYSNSIFVAAWEWQDSKILLWRRIDFNQQVEKIISNYFKDKPEFGGLFCFKNTAKITSPSISSDGKKLVFILSWKAPTHLCHDGWARQIVVFDLETEAYKLIDVDMQTVRFLPGLNDIIFMYSMNGKILFWTIEFDGPLHQVWLDEDFWSNEGLPNNRPYKKIESVALGYNSENMVIARGCTCCFGQEVLLGEINSYLDKSYKVINKQSGHAKKVVGIDSLGKKIIIKDPWDGSGIKIVDADTLAIICKCRQPGRLSNFVVPDALDAIFSPGGKFVAVEYLDGRILIYEV